MTTFETIHDPEVTELAWALFTSGDCPSLDDAARMASDIQFAIGDYAQEWDLDSLEWQIAAAYAAQVAA